MTKDERFLVELYRAVEGSLERVADLDALGKQLGLREHKLKNIVQGLARANLVKRCGDEQVTLTERGLEVAETLAL